MPVDLIVAAKVSAPLVQAGLKQLLLRLGRPSDFASVVKKLLSQPGTTRCLNALAESLASLEHSSEAFLNSPELREATFTCMTAAVNGTPSTVRAELGRVAASTMLIWLPKSEAATAVAALQAASDQIVEEASNLGLRLTLHQQEALIRRLELTLLASSARSLAEIASGMDDQRDSILEYERSVRSAASLNDQLVVGGAAAGTRAPIDAIYVTPTLRSIDTGVSLESGADSQSEFDLSPSSLIDSFRHVVILGDPGAGKTSLAHKISADIAKLDGQPLPIIVVLRDYGQADVLSHESLIDYIARILRVRHSITGDPGNLDILFRAGRILLILDGLDELLDTRVRSEVRDRIDSFCFQYPHVHTIATSRRVGYHEAPLDTRIFSTVEIRPFDDDQIRKYADLWFGLNCQKEGVDSINEEKLRLGFLFESESIPDLRSNPLMLSLLCDLYKGEGYLPANRPDVYQKC